MTRVELTKPFREDARRQVAPLVDGGEWTRVLGLIEGLAMLQRRLQSFPEIGRKLLGDDEQTLRRIALGQVPYFIWYRFDRRTQVVRFARLFHARQDTPGPRLHTL